MTATRAKELSEFTVLTTEAVGGAMALEAAHTSDPAFNAAMVLVEAVVQVDAGPVTDGLARHAASRS